MSGEHEKEKKAAVAKGVAAGWKIAKVTAKGYTVMRCSCGKHQETLKKTPSNPDHFRQKANRMVGACSTG